MTGQTRKTFNQIKQRASVFCFINNKKSNLIFSQKLPVNLQKVTTILLSRNSIQIYINTAFAPLVLLLKNAAPCIKNASHCRQYKITNTNNNLF